VSAYPKYRVSQWIDTSEEAMNKPQATIVYGIQTMRMKGGKWMHCRDNAGPLHYATVSDVGKALKALREQPAGQGEKPHG
jgi:hypothetical protein